MSPGVAAVRPHGPTCSQRPRRIDWRRRRDPERAQRGSNRGDAQPEFRFGKLGATVAAIRRAGDAYRLVPIDCRVTPLVNGPAIDPDGALLAFGDMIDVGSVKAQVRSRR